MDREQYEKRLKRKQEQHLQKIKSFQNPNWKPCLHDSCTSCCGTGIKIDGTICGHSISCPCPKCTPY